jgi:hypothetical protein
MPQAPKCRAKTNLRRRKPKRQVTQNERWLNLSSGKSDLQVTLQHLLAMISTFVLAMIHLLALITAYEKVADGDEVNYDALDAALESIAIVLMAFLGLLRAIQIAEGSSLTFRRMSLTCLYSSCAQRAYALMTSLIWQR